MIYNKLYVYIYIYICVCFFFLGYELGYTRKIQKGCSTIGFRGFICDLPWPCLDSITIGNVAMKLWDVTARQCRVILGLFDGKILGIEVGDCAGFLSCSKYFPLFPLKNPVVPLIIGFEVSKTRQG
jgi:hypothetical protein